jgi:hypothetical protein
MFFLFQMAVDGQGNPEPIPNWNGGATNTLGWLWPAHVYLFAVLFVLLTVVTFLALILKQKRNQNRYVVKAIMLSAVIVLAASRSVMLLVDPYLSTGKTSSWWIFGCILVTGIGTTSLTASLSILLYITTMSVWRTSTHRKLNLGAVVWSITIANFVFFITSDVVSMLWEDEGKIMLVVCQITFAVWGILVSIGFTTLTFQLRKNARATFEQARFNVTIRNEEERLKKLCALLGILAATSAIFFVLRIAEAISGLTSEKFSDAWSWWSIQTILRILEITNAIVLLLVFHRVKQEEVQMRTNIVSEGQSTWKNTSVKSTTDSI